MAARAYTLTRVRCIFSTSLFLVANPTLPRLHHRHLIKPQNTHNYVETHTLLHTCVAFFPVSLQPRAGSYQEWGSIMSVG